MVNVFNRAPRPLETCFIQSWFRKLTGWCSLCTALTIRCSRMDSGAATEPAYRKEGPTFAGDCLFQYSLPIRRQPPSPNHSCEHFVLGKGTLLWENRSKSSFENNYSVTSTG